MAPFWLRVVTIFAVVCILFHPPYPYPSMPGVRLTENGKSSPSWYQTSWKMKNCPSSKGGWEWDEGPSGPPLVEEGGESYHASDGARDLDKSHSGAKKIKNKRRIPESQLGLSVACQSEVGREEKKPTSKETNDKVYALNQQTSKHLVTLALLYENFEQACNEKKEAEEEFNKEFYSLLEKVAASRSRCSEASAAYDRAEMAINEGLGLVRSQFEETSSATLALTQGTQARSSNENAYLQEALVILDALLLRGTHEVRGC